MIVRKIDNAVFQRPKRNALQGRAFHFESKKNSKDFEQHLIDAFGGEVVKKSNGYSSTQSHRLSPKLSTLMQENLIRLS